MTKTTGILSDGFYFAFGHPAYPERGLAEALLICVSATPPTDSGADQKQGYGPALMTEQDLTEIAVDSNNSRAHG